MRPTGGLLTATTVQRQHGPCAAPVFVLLVLALLSESPVVLFNAARLAMLVRSGRQDVLGEFAALSWSLRETLMV